MAEAVVGVLIGKLSEALANEAVTYALQGSFCPQGSL
ncbi:hypothetical protein ACP70R_004095 [Stipagrostis hirtigluma subsp. patula]